MLTFVDTAVMSQETEGAGGRTSRRDHNVIIARHDGEDKDYQRTANTCRALQTALCFSVKRMKDAGYFAHEGSRYWLSAWVKRHQKYLHLHILAL